MQNNTKQILEDKLLGLFEENVRLISANDTPAIREARQKAIEDFRNTGLPTMKLESWKNTDLSQALRPDLRSYFEPGKEKIDIDKVFQCEVPDFDTHIVSLYNGWYVFRDGPLVTLPNGTVIGSIARAMTELPGLVDLHFNKYIHGGKNGLNALNTAFAQDGIFIYVPDGVETYKPIQMVNVLNRENSLFVQNRNLIIAGKNSRVSIIHCDDSQNYNSSFTNTVTEVFMDEGSVVDHYKLQNLNNNSTLINSAFFHQERNSRLTTNMLTLNGGLIRNDTHVALKGAGSRAEISGLYLMDKEQHVDNQVFIDHAVPDCESHELFKGILDDQASGVFKGHILVRKDAQQTNAYQTNRNILLTDKATVNSKPFLEIYADNVKCSHGATVGQLDDEAMFYIKSRGISGHNARLLLMYAFAAEVIGKISIRPLKDRIDDLVKKRLRGELAVCDQCVLHCKNQEKKYTFDIDMSKI
ncbi:MAG: Fe-S cluster assembly protein SufD [Bacteroidales bacterium]|nr:Fe-S cluster assembly protein SufD [Bacteroidales bacterium]